MGKRIAISGVQAGSAAEEAGIRPGDFLLAVNGQKIHDIFDYRFLATDSRLVLEIEKSDGEAWEIEIEKDEYEDPGLEFEDPLITGARSCSNKCIFCFIDQLPPGMRKTLYFKDDDSRLSFLSGNYATLTNMKKGDLERIVRYRMSPVNVSVHSTNPELRKFLLGNRFAGDILEKVGVLADGGIRVNAQVVLCKGLNDGKELDRTLNDLARFFPAVGSISTVPVGLTRWRQGLYRLEPYNGEESAAVLDQVEGWQGKFLEKLGTRLVYAADEFYIKAGRELPPCGAYEDFPQIENGVGMMALFMQEFYDYVKKHGRKMDRCASKFNTGSSAGSGAEIAEASRAGCCAGPGMNAAAVFVKYPGAAVCARTVADAAGNQEADAGSKTPGGRIVSVATGLCAYGHIKELAQTLEKRYNSLKVHVYPIENEFFGENVTVAGLLTGRDICAQLDGKELGDELLLPGNLLKAGEELLLDDVTVGELGARLGAKVVIVENNGADFAKKIIGMR